MYYSFFGGKTLSKVKKKNILTFKSEGSLLFIYFYVFHLHKIVQMEEAKNIQQILQYNTR